MRRLILLCILCGWPLASSAAMQGSGSGPGGGQQRLPDSVIIAGRAADVSYYSADLLLRYGFSDELELNFGAYIYNYSRFDTGAQTITDSGMGDVRVGLRYSPENFRNGFVTLRGGITLPTGDDAFSVDDETLDAGVEFGWFTGERQSAGIGLSGSYSDSWQSLYGSLAWSFLFNPVAGGYLEAGAYGGDASGTIAGGGLNFRVADGTDFNVYALAGVDDEAPDLQAGIGLSIRFD